MVVASAVASAVAAAAAAAVVQRVEHTGCARHQMGCGTAGSCPHPEARMYRLGRRRQCRSRSRIQRPARPQSTRQSFPMQGMNGQTSRPHSWEEQEADPVAAMVAAAAVAFSAAAAVVQRVEHTGCARHQMGCGTAGSCPRPEARMYQLGRRRQCHSMPRIRQPAQPQSTRQSLRMQGMNDQTSRPRIRVGTVAR